MELLHGLWTGIVEGNWVYFQIWVEILRVRLDPVLCWESCPAQAKYEIILGLAFWGLVILGVLLYNQVKDLRRS